MIEGTVAHLRRGVMLVNEPKDISGKSLDLVVKSASPIPLNRSFENVEFSGAAAKENVDPGGNGGVVYEAVGNEVPSGGGCTIQ